MNQSGDGLGCFGWYIPRGNSRNGVGEIFRKLVQLKPLPDGGFVENVIWLAVKSGEVSVKKSVCLGGIWR